MNIPEVLLNHFYLVLDDETYRDIENSEFLRQHFAPSEVRTTHRTDISYSGLYFYGGQTYFEFFGETGGIDRQPGQSAIAFGLEHEGDTARIAALGTEPPFVVTRPYGEGQLPWFWFLRLPQNDFLKLWTMEYLPSFLEEWNPSPTPADGLRRSEVLSRYKSVVAPVPNPLFEEITAIELHLNDADWLKVLLQGLGYQTQSLANGWVATGPDGHRIGVRNEADTQGIRAVSFKIKAIDEPLVMGFGRRSVLKLEGDQALWTF